MRGALDLEEGGGGEAALPDVAVPAEFDQFFVCGGWGGQSSVGRGGEDDGGGRGGGRTFEFVFAYVDGGWGVDYVGGEVVDHCRWWGVGWMKIEKGGCKKLGNEVVNSWGLAEARREG